MEDHTTRTETMELQDRRDDEETTLRHFLSGNILDLDEDSISLISKHVDYFVNQSQGNKKVEIVDLALLPFNNRDHEVWDKVGHAIGNLQSLEMLRITTDNDHYESDYSDGDDEAVPPAPILDWEN
jgi:hypothetical protein